jgi:hypothetical protein
MSFLCPGDRPEQAKRDFFPSSVILQFDLSKNSSGWISTGDFQEPAEALSVAHGSSSQSTPSERPLNTYITDDITVDKYTLKKSSSISGLTTSSVESLKEDDYDKSEGTARVVIFDIFGSAGGGIKPQQQGEYSENSLMDYKQELSFQYSAMILCPFQIAGRYPRPGMHSEYTHWYDLIADEVRVRF